jgi:hypothetical protein
MRQAIWALGLAAIVAGCGNGTTTPTTPSTPTPVSVTDTYSGELKTGTSSVHHLEVGTGVVSATLSTLTPSDGTLIGTAYGLWDGTNCNAITPTAVETTSMGVGLTLVGTAMQPVSLCVKVFDAGNIAEGATYSYTMSVVHY